MEVTVEQTALNTLLLAQNPMTFPILAYDKVNTEITIWVIVIPSADPLHPIFQVPPIAIVGPLKGGPPPTWTLSWNFVSDGTLTDLYDIQILDPVLGSSSSFPVVSRPKVPGRFDQWEIEFITDNVTLSRLRYDIVARSSGVLQEVHDPTIVVTPDPIDS